MNEYRFEMHWRIEGCDRTHPHLSAKNSTFSYSFRISYPAFVTAHLWLPPAFRRNGEGTVFTGVSVQGRSKGIPTVDGRGGTYLGWGSGTYLG